MIRSKKQFSRGIFIIIVLLLLGTNPLEEHYLDRVAEDYTGLHQGMKIKTADLQAMGQSTKNNYLLFSTYKYQFGNIGVSYFGMAGTIFYTGSFYAETRDRAPSRSV